MSVQPENTISIIVPVFNSTRTLERCASSILRQTYAGLELILVDDGSSDGSSVLCDQIAKSDSRVTVLHLKNGGVSRARNTGIRVASGAYIQFVDSDDYIAPQMCETMLQALRGNNADLVSCGVQTKRSGRIETTDYPDAVYHNMEDLNVDFSYLFCQNFFHSPCNKLYCRKLITSGFPEDASLGEDLLFNFNYFQWCRTVVSLRKPFYFYIFSNTDSLTQKIRPNQFEIATNLYRQAHVFCDKIGICSENRWGISETYLHMVFYCCQDAVYNKSLTRAKRCKILNAYIENDCVRKAVKDGSRESVQMHLVTLLIRCRMRFLVEFFFHMKKMISALRSR